MVCGNLHGRPAQIAERVKRADSDVLALDIETIKGLLKFPDRAIDQIIVILGMATSSPTETSPTRTWMISSNTPIFNIFSDEHLTQISRAAIHFLYPVKRICRYVFNDSKSAGLRPDRNNCELNVQEEIQKVCTPKTR